MPDRDEDEVLTIKAAAEVLDVSEKTLRRWDKAGNSARNVMGTGCTLAAKFLELRKQIFSGIEKAHEGLHPRAAAAVPHGRRRVVVP